METKWQDKWNYYGWKEYLDTIPNRDTMQKDWNTTFSTKLNLMAKEIKNVCNGCEIGISVHPNLYELLLVNLPFKRVSEGITYVCLHYSVNLDTTLSEDKVYMYDKTDETNIGEIIIDFVAETRD